MNTTDGSQRKELRRVMLLRWVQSAFNVENGASPEHTRTEDVPQNISDVEAQVLRSFC
jgi:hypothetical protein